MDISKKLIGIFGGTFDPIHWGHLNVAQTLFKNLPFEQIQFIPCGIPPHGKKPIANATDRLQMVKLAITDYPYFFAQDIEIKKSTPAYTIETLQTLQPVFEKKILCLILSTDAFAGLNTWFHWKEVLHYCHIIVANRLGFSLPDVLWIRKLLSQHQTENSKELSTISTGKIFFQSTDKVPITATALRTQLAQGDFTHAEKSIPSHVLEYIKQHHLYH